MSASIEIDGEIVHEDLVECPQEENTLDGTLTFSIEESDAEEQTANKTVLDTSCPVFWSRAMTCRMVQEYRRNFRKVGVTLKNQRSLYTLIANRLTTEFNFPLNYIQVNNKFRSMIKTYRSIDFSKPPGRDRKGFEFRKEFEEIIKYDKRLKKPVTAETFSVSSSSFRDRNPPLTIKCQPANDQPSSPIKIHQIIDSDPISRSAGSTSDATVYRVSGPASQPGSSFSSSTMWRQKLEVYSRIASAMERKNEILEERNRLFSILIRKLDA